MTRARRLKRVFNIDDMEALARRRLPRAVYDAVAGGAGDEITVRANRKSFEDRVWLRPRPLVDLSDYDSSTTVLGQRVSMPVLLAPTGMARMCDSEAESAIARAAGRAGTVFVVSSASSQPLEQVVENATGPLWYGFYIPPDRADATALLERVQAAGFPVLCMTIDSGISLKRERDLRNDFSVPLRMTPRLLLTGISKPRWTKDFVLGKVGRVRGTPGSGLFAARRAYQSLANVVTRMKVPTWEDIHWVREHWDGKLVLKGVTRGDEVPAMIDAGVDAIAVSNHGGRNLDCIRPTIEILPEVVAAARGRAEVYVDGGVRRGTDVVKALALGANAVMIGRPYMWGLAAGGEAGVDAVLAFYKSELQRAMGYCGLPTVASIDERAIRVDFERGTACRFAPGNSENSDCVEVVT